MAATPLRFRIDPRRIAGPELLIAFGSLLALAGTVAVLLALAVLASDAAGPFLAPAIVTGVSSLLAVGLIARRHRRTPRSYLLIALVASAVVLPSDPPNLLGGGLALAGAVWGILRTYGGEGSKAASAIRGEDAPREDR